MNTYTIVLDYRGGTYIRQVAANCEFEALRIWSQSITPGEIRHLGKSRIARVASEIELNFAGIFSPTPIQGLVNVWCSGLPVFHGLINIIKTELRP